MRGQMIRPDSGTETAQKRYQREEKSENKNNKNEIFKLIYK